LTEIKLLIDVLTVECNRCSVGSVTVKTGSVYQHQ